MISDINDHDFFGYRYSDADCDTNGDVRKQVLTTAFEYVNGDRDRQYGNPETCFRIIADFWSCYLGRIITADDVGMMMILLKIARTISGAEMKLDNYIDIAGYAACTGEIVENAKKRSRELGTADHD